MTAPLRGITRTWRKPNPGNPHQESRLVSQLYEFRLRAWHIYRWNVFCKAWRGCASHLSRLYFAGAADFQRRRLLAECTEPSANPDELAAAVFDCIDAGARVINLSLALARHSTGSRKSLKVGSRPRYASRRHRHCRGGKSEYRWQQRHHQPSLGYPNHGMRSRRFSFGLFKCRALHRRPGSSGAGRWRNQLRRPRRVNLFLRNQRRGPLRYRHDRVAVVYIPCCNSPRDEAGPDTSAGAANQHRPAAAQCMDRIPDIGDAISMRTNVMTTETPQIEISPDKTSRIFERERNRHGRCDQACHFVSWHRSVRRLPGPGRGIEPLVRAFGKLPNRTRFVSYRK